MKYALASIFAFLTLMLTSCAQRCQISTNSFVNSQEIQGGFHKGTSFSLVPLQTKNVLFSQEVGRKIEKLLDEKGYSVANVSDSEYCLFFDFDISSSSGIMHVPHYTPGQTQTTQGNVYGGYGGYAQYNQTTQSSGTTTYIPQTYVFFTRSLKLLVYDAKLLKTKKVEKLVWSGNSVSSGQNGDLREMIDYLLIASFRHFGKSTGKCIETDIKLNDEAIKKLREN